MDLAVLGLGVQSTQVDQANRSLDRFQREALGAETAANRYTAGTRRASAASSQMATSVNTSNAALTRSVGLMRQLSTALIAFGAGALAFRQYITNTIEAEEATAKLAAGIKSTGGVSGQTVKSLQEHARALQQLTTFGDEAIMGGQQMLLTFTRIREVFPRATEAVLNLAARLGGDAASAARLLGRALDDPIRGMSTLSRAGVQFTSAQREVIKQLVESGQLVKAQTMILDELEKKVGGTAAALRGTLGGALTSLTNAWGDLFEITGGASEMLRQAIERLITAVQSPEFARFAQQVGRAVFGALTSMFNVLTKIVEILPTATRLVVVFGTTMAVHMGMRLVATIAAVVGQMIALEIALGATGRASALFSIGMKGVQAAINMVTVALARNPFGLIALGITAAVSALTVFRDEIQPVAGEVATLGDYMRAAWEMVAPIISHVGQAIVAVATDAKTALMDAFGPVVGEFIAAFFSALGTMIKAQMNGVIGIFIFAAEAIAVSWNKLPQAIGDVVLSIVKGTLSAISDMVNKAIEGINSVISLVNEIPGVDIGALGGVDFGSAVVNKFEGAAGDLGANLQQSFNKAFTTDHIGNITQSLGTFFDTLRTRANEIGKLRTESEAASAALGGLGEEAGGATEELGDLGGSAGDAGMKLSEAQVAAERAQEAMAALKQSLGQLATSTVQGFLSDMKNSLREGASLWEAFANAALNALDKVVDSLMNSAISGLFSTLFSGGLSNAAMAAISGRSGIHHQGGVVGSSNGVSKAFHPATWANAPHFAKGLGASGLGINEVPIIAHKGEVVGWPSQMRDAFGGGAQKIVIEDHSNRGVKFEERKSQNPGELRLAVQDIVAEGIASGQFDEVNAARYGSRPARRSMGTF